MKKNKNIITIGIISAVIIIFAIVAYLSPYITFFDAISSHNVDKNQLVLQFNKHKDDFQRTANYLKENQDNIYIERTSSMKYVSHNGNEQIKITDSKVTDDIKYILFSLNFEFIDEENNDIYFIRSTGLSSVQAIVYSKDGNIPQPYRPKVVENISGNWYYCEAEDAR